MQPDDAPAGVQPGGGQPGAAPYGAPALYDVPVHQGLDDSTGTFTRVLLTGLGGEAELPPAPPLRVGVGARDGESIPLARLLRQRLDAGDDG